MLVCWYVGVALGTSFAVLYCPATTMTTLTTKTVRPSTATSSVVTKQCQSMCELYRTCAHRQPWHSQLLELGPQLFDVFAVVVVVVVFLLLFLPLSPVVFVIIVSIVPVSGMLS